MSATTKKQHGKRRLLPNSIQKFSLFLPSVVLLVLTWCTTSTSEQVSVTNECGHSEVAYLHSNPIVIFGMAHEHISGLYVAVRNTYTPH